MCSKLKLRLILKTNTNKNKEVSIKFNIAPSKHLGFINFINLALNQDNPITLSFEKIGKSGVKEESKIVGNFKFTGKDDLSLTALNEEIQENERKKKKQRQKRVQK
jgi:type VI protein secretion system component Hcp